MTKLPPVLVVGLFVVGLVIGGVVFAAGNPGPPPNPYQSMAKLPEPAVTAEIAAALKSDDPHALSKIVDDSDVLKNLSNAIAPLVEVTDVTFVGATGLNGETLAAYLATGRDSDRQKLARGFVLHVQGGKLVGVN